MIAILQFAIIIYDISNSSDVVFIRRAGAAGGGKLKKNTKRKSYSVDRGTESYH